MSQSLPDIEPGDRIGIASPAGPASEQLIRKGIQLLRDWDLDVVFNESIFAADEDKPYLAESDETRLNQLQSLIDDPTIKAILFTRGGYGSMRLLPHLDLGSLRKSPKLMTGFSDLTALHFLTFREVGLPSLHSPVVKTLNQHQTHHPPTLEHLKHAIFDGLDTTGFDDLRTVSPGKAEGKLLGGNLSIVAALAGTDYTPDFTEKILFVEEIGEPDYRLDRMFTTLRLSNKVGSPAGIALGTFTDCGGSYIDESGVTELVENLAQEFDCPIVSGLPVGHGDRNMPLPLGVDARLDGTKGTLELQS